MPPEWMWPLDEEVAVWMQRVVDERREKFGGGSDRDDSREKVPMMENEYARGRR